MSEDFDPKTLDGLKKENETSDEFRNRLLRNARLNIQSTEQYLEKKRAEMETRKERGEVFPEITVNLPDPADKEAYRKAMSSLAERLKKPRVS